MAETYFTDIQYHLKSLLRTANHHVRIAVAWINFKLYQDVFTELLSRGVKLEIVTNDIQSNTYPRNLAVVNQLRQLGAIIQIKNFGTLMHNKFCLIDEELCITGSFNWTDKADNFNLENIEIVRDASSVYSYLQEFKNLQELSASDFQILRKPEICEFCNCPIFYIFGFEQEGYYDTRVHLFRHCGCDWTVGKEVDNDLLDISYYNNYEAIIDQYSDIEERYYGEMTKEEADRLSAELNYEVQRYFSSIRLHKMNCPIIHAVGIQNYQVTDKDGGGYWCYKILWKERGMENYIEDEYEI